MNELEKLMQHYGVASAAKSAYSGNEMPTDITDPEYAQRLADYQADQASHGQYGSEFDKRTSSVSQYGPGWQGDTLGGPNYRGKRAPRVVPKAVADVISSVLQPAAVVSGGDGTSKDPMAATTQTGYLNPVASGGPSGMNDMFHSIQEGINTPTGSAASWMLGKLGLLGTMTQDPSNVPVVDTMGETVADMQARYALAEQQAEHERQVAAEAEAQRQAQAAADAQAQADAQAAAEVQAQQVAAQQAAEQQAAQQAAQDAANQAAQAQAQQSSARSAQPTVGVDQNGAPVGAGPASPMSSGPLPTIAPTPAQAPAPVVAAPKPAPTFTNAVPSLVPITTYNNDYGDIVTGYRDPTSGQAYDANMNPIGGGSSRGGFGGNLSNSQMQHTETNSAGSQTTGGFGSSASAATGGFVTNGAVKHFAGGGLAELNAKYAPPGMEGSGDIPGNMGLDMSRVSPQQLALMQQQDPMALQRGEDRFLENDISSHPTLQAMAQKYEEPAPRQYMDAFNQGRIEDKANQAAFNKMVEDAMAQKSEGPSKAEMYFNLAAAFGAPTRTGSFVESMGNAGKTMGEYTKSARESKAADLARRQALGMQVAQARAQASRADQSDLRQLAIQEQKDYLASKQPQSSSGKQAVDEGLRPGTSGFQTRVGEIGDMVVKKQTAQIDAILAAQGNQGARLELAKGEAAAKEKERSKLTTSEMKLKTDAEDSLASAAGAYDSLKKAIALNPNTFDTSLPDKVQRIALEQAGSTDKKVVDTREMENLLEKAALGSLKSTFPGAISNDERKVLMDTQGLGAKSREERAKIMNNAAAVLRTVYARHKARLADINAGKYRETTPDTPIDTGE